MDEKPRTVAAISNVIANNTSVISVFDWRLGGGDCESIGFQSVKLVGLIQPENFPTVLVSNMNLKTELEFRFFFFFFFSALLVSSAALHILNEIWRRPHFLFLCFIHSFRTRRCALRMQNKNEKIIEVVLYDQNGRCFYYFTSVICRKWFVIFMPFFFISPNRPAVCMM